MYVLEWPYQTPQNGTPPVRDTVEAAYIYAERSAPPAPGPGLPKTLSIVSRPVHAYTRVLDEDSRMQRLWEEETDSLRRHTALWGRC